MKFKKTKDWRGKTSLLVQNEQGSEVGQLVKEQGALRFKMGGYAGYAFSATELREIADRLERPAKTKRRKLPTAPFAALNEHERSAVLLDRQLSDEGGIKWKDAKWNGSGNAATCYS